MASILDTFLILFESNADDVDKGAKQAERSTKDLNDSLKSTQAATENVGAAFVQMISSAAGAVASVLSVAAITGAVISAANDADKLNDFTQRLGLNIEEVNAWGDAVAKNGGTAEGFRGSLDSLIDGLVTFATKGTSRVAPFFKELGIQMVDANGKARDVMEILPELADAFAGLSKQESAGLGRKIGLDQGTIQLLQQGRREVDAQIAREKELGTVTQEAADIAGAFNDSMDDTAKVFRSLFTIVGSTILPVFTSIQRGLQVVGQFLVKHSDFVVGLLIAISAAVMFYAVPAFITMAASVIAAFAPFILMGIAVAAAAAAFALLYDDIMNFIDGNDSLIGQIMESYPIIGTLIQGLIDYLKSLWGVVSWVFDTISSLLQISIEGWRLLFGAISDGVAGFVEDSSIMQAWIKGIGMALEAMGAIATGVWDGITAAIQTAIGWVMKGMELLKSFGATVSNGLASWKSSLGITGLPEGKEALSTASSLPISSTTSSTINNSARTGNKSTSVQTGPITVNTQAVDGATVAGELGKTLGQQMRQAASSFDDGVEA